MLDQPTNDLSNAIVHQYFHRVFTEYVKLLTEKRKLKPGGMEEMRKFKQD